MRESDVRIRRRRNVMVNAPTQRAAALLILEHAADGDTSLSVTWARLLLQGDDEDEDDEPDDDEDEE